MSFRPRSTVSPNVPRKRLRRMPSRNRGRKLSITRSISMKGPAVHVLTRTCSIAQSFSNLGIVPQVGLVAGLGFSIWFTNQSAFLYRDAANYSTVSIAGYSDLAALFDEVKVDAIELTIIPGIDPTTSGTGSGVLGMCTDYNDKAAPAALGDIQQYNDYKNVSMANNYIYKEIIRPKFLEYSLDSGGSAQASVSRTGFVRSNLDIDHYGKKCFFVSVPPNASVSTFIFKYKFLCKVSK